MEDIQMSTVILQFMSRGQNPSADLLRIGFTSYISMLNIRNKQGSQDIQLMIVWLSWIGRSDDDGVQWARLPDVNMTNVNVPGSSRPLETGSTIVHHIGSTMVHHVGSTFTSYLLRTVWLPWLHWESKAWWRKPSFSIIFQADGDVLQGSVLTEDFVCLQRRWKRTFSPGKRAWNGTFQELFLNIVRGDCHKMSSCIVWWQENVSSRVHELKWPRSRNSSDRQWTAQITCMD